MGRLPHRRELDGTLEESLTAHREPSTPRRFDSWTEALTDGRKTGGRMRRMVESSMTFGTGLFGSSLVVPDSEGYGDVSSGPPTKGKRQAASAFESLASYLVYNVFLCYMYKPDLTKSDAPNMGNGEEVKAHRSSHMCFPAIPFGNLQIPTFNETFSIDPELLIDNGVSYEKICAQRHVTEARRIAEDYAKTLRLRSGTPYYTAWIRLFEYPAASVTAVSNIYIAATANSTLDRTTAVICAVTRLNAVLWLICFAIIFFTFYCVCCWPFFRIGVMCCSCFCDPVIRACCPKGRRRRRNGRNPTSTREASPGALTSVAAAPPSDNNSRIKFTFSKSAIQRSERIVEKQSLLGRHSDADLVEP